MTYQIKIGLLFELSRFHIQIFNYNSKAYYIRIEFIMHIRYTLLTRIEKMSPKKQI